MLTSSITCPAENEKMKPEQDTETERSSDPQGQVQALVMSDLKYRQTMWAEMKPDLYAGDSCDEVRPLFEGFADGDMDSDVSETIEFSAKHFPAGTKILVLEPECPKCHQVPELCRGDDCCDFDWDMVRDNSYS